MDFKTKFEKNKGITLIALVVTIIVLLILAGISITMLIGQNGILNRAGEAKNANGVAQGEELIKVSVMDALTRGTGELTDENLKKALSSNLGTEGKDYEIVGSEDCGWTVTIKENDKDYKISSTGKIGEIEKVEGSSGEWRVEGNAVVEYLGSSNDIVVPNYVDGVKITEIGANIFSNSTKTGTVTISDGIKVIDKNAFSSSKFTGELILPSTVKEIKTQAFASCTGFSGNLEIPASVETIGDFAFVGWSGENLNNLIVPGSIKNWGHNVFTACSGFKGNLVLKEGLKTIGDYAFTQSSGFTGTLEIPNTVEIIGEDAFALCSGFEGELKIPNSVKKIETSAFNNCTGFTGNLIIPETVEEVGLAAFSGCSGFNGDLIIYDNVKIVDVSTFSNTGFEGTVYIGNDVEGIYLWGMNVKRVIMNSMPASYAMMQSLPKVETMWLSSNIIKDVNKAEMFTRENSIRKDVIIYTDAAEDDPNWPESYNPYGVTIKFNVSLDEYHKLTD